MERVLYFATEARFIRGTDGIYAPGTFGDTLWERYLQVFDKVVVIARVQNTPDFIGEKTRLIKNPGVSFLSIPYYQGPRQFLRVKHRLYKAIESSIDSNGAYICRVPGTIGNIVIKYLKKAKLQYACEVVGDPWDVWSGEGPYLLIRPLLKLRGSSILKKSISCAGAVLYVTNETLQRRYPASPGAFVTSASNVVINEDFAQGRPKVYSKKDTINILCTGALYQMYKAPDIVLQSIRLLRDSGYKVFLKWLGGGDYLEKMESLSNELGISDYVNFAGSTQHPDVIASLSVADLFVMASRTEGMPRALIEAMAMGLPCVGTRVGGIPELLDESVLIPKDDPRALAGKIKELIDNPAFMNKQAERNYSEAQNYREKVLQSKRKEFYKYVKDMA